MFGRHGLWQVRAASKESPPSGSCFSRSGRWALGVEGPWGQEQVGALVCTGAWLSLCHPPPQGSSFLGPGSRTAGRLPKGTVPFLVTGRDKNPEGD